MAFNVSLTTVGLPDSLASMINLFVITPLLAKFNQLFQELLICRCVKEGRFRRQFEGWVEFIDGGGIFIGSIFLAGGLMLLLIASLLSSGNDSVGIVGEYILQVQLYSVFVEVYKAWIKAYSFVYIRFEFTFARQEWLKALTRNVQDYMAFSCGERFLELIANSDDMREGYDYIDMSVPHHSNSLYRFEMLLDWNVAVKWGIRSNRDRIASSKETADGILEDTVDENPLQKDLKIDRQITMI